MLIDYICILREKERYLIHSYDKLKAPLPTENSKKQCDNAKTPPNCLITQ